MRDIKKELVEYLKIEGILNVKRLIDYLAINNGKKIKYEEVCATCSLDYRSVKEFIEVLRETYLIIILRPFFTNKNKELVKVPKIYFIDNGARNFLINNVNGLKLRDDAGFLFEGYVISELLKLGVEDSLKFWQNKNKNEVDLIIDNLQERIPIEIKYKNRLKHEDFIGLSAFSKEYRSKGDYLINMGVQKKIKGVRAILGHNVKRISTTS